MKYFYKGVEYIPYEGKDTAKFVKCPLVDEFIENGDCLETRDLNPYLILPRFTKKENYREICEACPFHNY